MPELAEVECSRRLLERLLSGRVVEKLRVDDDEKVFGNVAPKQFAKEFKGKKVLRVLRKGKHLIVEVDGPGRNMYFHQGMTGAFCVKRSSGVREAALKFKVRKQCRSLRC